MKKLIAVFLAIALLLGLAACGKTDNDVMTNDKDDKDTILAELYAPERTKASFGAVKQTDDLNNTYYKLTKEKKLQVAYLGGSVTNGHGGTDGYCWRSATTEWFKANFPSAEITETNAGWGGTGSYWGYFRIDEHVLSHNPDLVFVEFAINDAYAGHDDISSSLYMEGIVNKIRNHNPNCDIVFVFVTDNNNSGRLGKEYEQLLAHKDVAAHYGIPTINVGFALVDEMNRTGNKWEHYVIDIVHPNNNGYKVYADCVAAQLKKWLVDSPNKAGLLAHEKPENNLVSNLSVESEIVKAEQLKNYSGFILSASKANKVSHIGKTLYGAVGATIDFEFTGRGLGVLVDAEKLPTVEISVDGGKPFEWKFANGLNEICLLDNLNFGKHTVNIKVTQGTKIVIGGFLVAK